MPGRLPGQSSKVYLLDIAREMTGEPEWRDKLSGVYTSHDLLDPMYYITALGDGQRQVASGRQPLFRHHSQHRGIRC